MIDPRLVQVDPEPPDHRLRDLVARMWLVEDGPDAVQDEFAHRAAPLVTDDPAEMLHQGHHILPGDIGPGRPGEDRGEGPIVLLSHLPLAPRRSSWSAHR